MRGLDCDAVREMWAEVENSQRWAHIFRAKGELVVPPLANTVGWFRDSLNMVSHRPPSAHQPFGADL